MLDFRQPFSPHFENGEFLQFQTPRVDQTHVVVCGGINVVYVHCIRAENFCSKLKKDINLKYF
jgi:hypothetical protein